MIGIRQFKLYMTWTQIACTVPMVNKYSPTIGTKCHISLEAGGRDGSIIAQGNVQPSAISGERGT